MDTNRLVKVVIVVALLVVGIFTFRAMQNTREIVSSGSTNVPETQPTQEVVETATAAEEPVVEDPVQVSQPFGTSVLDLVRVVNLTVAPHDFAVDGQGNIYVVDSTSPQIHKYDRAGNLLVSWGGQGGENGQFSFAPPPDGPPLDGGFVTLDEQGNIYVSDTFNNRVQKFDPNGNFIGSWGTLGEGGSVLNVPGPISSDLNGNIFVADFDGVHQFNLDGGYVKSLQTAGEVAVDSQGNLYSPIAFQNMVAKMDSAGQVTTWGGEGDREDGTFNFPMTLLIDAQDRIYVGDQSGRLQIFDTEGNFLGRFNMTTTDQLQVMVPIIAALDPEELIHVGAKDRSAVYVLRTLQASEAMQTYPEGSLAAALEADGRFTTVLRLFDQAKGAETVPWPWLQNPERTLTLFAPTDDAFSAVPAETIERLATDKALAEKLLTHHLLDRRLLSSDFGVLPTWPTVLTTQKIVIESVDGGYKYAGANVIEMDIEAGAGIIHIIDAVTGLQLLDN